MTAELFPIIDPEDERLTSHADNPIFLENGEINETYLLDTYGIGITEANQEVTFGQHHGTVWQMLSDESCPVGGRLMEAYKEEGTAGTEKVLTGFNMADPQFSVKISESTRTNITELSNVFPQKPKQSEVPTKTDNTNEHSSSSTQQATIHDIEKPKLAIASLDEREAITNGPAIIMRNQLIDPKIAHVTESTIFTSVESPAILDTPNIQNTQTSNVALLERVHTKTDILENVTNVSEILQLQPYPDHIPILDTATETVFSTEESPYTELKMTDEDISLFEAELDSIKDHLEAENIVSLTDPTPEDEVIDFTEKLDEPIINEITRFSVTPTKEDLIDMVGFYSSEQLESAILTIEHLSIVEQAIIEIRASSDENSEEIVALIDEYQEYCILLFEELGLNINEDDIKRLIETLTIVENTQETKEIQLQYERLNKIGTREYLINQSNTSTFSITKLIKRKIYPNYRLGEYIIGAISTN